MSLIRAGGFVFAFAVHGLLLLFPPDVHEPQRFSRGGNSDQAVALSIGYEPQRAAVADAKDVTEKKASKPQVLTKPKVSTRPLRPNTDNKAKVNAIAAQELDRKAQTVSNKSHLMKNSKEETFSVAQTVRKTALTDDNDTVRSSVKAANNRPNDHGVHKAIITEPLFSRSPVPPHYPQIARKRGQQGTVWVDVFLDKRGRQLRTDIFQSSGVSPLDRAALDAVKQWQFIAHRINDIAVASHIRIPVEFSLD